MKSLALVFTLLVCSLAWAEEPTSHPVTVTFNLPHGTTLKTDGETYRGYTLEEFKIILHIYMDYSSWSKQIPALKLQVASLESLASNNERQLKLADSTIAKLESERNLLTKKWKEENRLRHLAENKPSFGGWVAWGAAAVMTTVAAVLSIIIVVKE